MRVTKLARGHGVSDPNYCLNCWNTLKLIEPQRSDEIGASVTVTKVEKINQIAHG